MATELEGKLRTILEQKQNYILPENIKADITILGVQGTSPVIYSSIAEMNEHLDLAEGTMAIVFNINLIGIYKLFEDTWIEIGQPLDAVLAMTDLNETSGTEDEYTGLGDTVENINSDLDEILGS